MNKLLILGGSGMLGSSLIAECIVTKLPFEAPSSTSLDITNKKDLQSYISSHKPIAVVNCAAWTDVENSEIEFPRALKLNADAVFNIAIAAKSVGVPVVHISTDYVFDGTKKEPYSEHDLTNPINSYGASKLQGERILMDVYPENSYVIRTSWLYAATGKNFVKSILKKALAHQKIQVIQDQIGSPTNSRDLAQGIIALLNTKLEAGVYHFSNAGKISWYEFATKIYNLAGTDVGLVEPIAAHSYPSKVKRPDYSVLATEKWEKAEITQILQWEDSLTKVFPKVLETVRKEETS